MDPASRLISSALAMYDSGLSSVQVDVRPVNEAPTAPAPNVSKGTKPRFAVELDWQSESNLYAGFSDEPDGVFVATHNLLPIGSLVDLEVTLPDGRTFSTTGRVRWVQDPRDRTTSEAQPGLGIELTREAERTSWIPTIGPRAAGRPPVVQVQSIRPLRLTDARALGDFGKARVPVFFDE